MDGALFAAAALRLQGHPPLIVDLEAVQDDDHVIAVFQRRGLWGSVARSNYSGLRYREPLHRTIRGLVLSYFEWYYNLRREKTLRRFSRPIDLSRFDRIDWMTTEDDLWEIPDYLVDVKHETLMSGAMIQELGTADGRAFNAGLVGRE